MTFLRPDEILDKAADDIEAHGHIQHVLVQRGLSSPTVSTSAKCVMGGINYAATGSCEYPFDAYGHLGEAPMPAGWKAATQLLFDHLDLTPESASWLSPFGKVVSAVANWNNAPGRTQEEVVAACRGAAAAYREREGIPS